VRRDDDRREDFVRRPLPASRLCGRRYASRSAFSFFAGSRRVGEIVRANGTDQTLFLSMWTTSDGPAQLATATERSITRRSTLLERRWMLRSQRLRREGVHGSRARPGSRTCGHEGAHLRPIDGPVHDRRSGCRHHFSPRAQSLQLRPSTIRSTRGIRAVTSKRTMEGSLPRQASSVGRRADLSHVVTMYPAAIGRFAGFAERARDRCSSRGSGVRPFQRSPSRRSSLQALPTTTGTSSARRLRRLRIWGWPTASRTLR